MSAILFYTFYSIIWLLTLLPLKILYIISDLLYLLSYYAIGYRKKVVFTNLRNAFPEKTEKERKKIARKFYQHLADLFIESLKLIHYNSKDVAKRVKVKNAELINTYYSQGKSVIAIVGHYGNWEWLNSFASQIPHKSLAIYKQVNNPYFNRFMFKIRSTFPTELVPMKETLRTVLAYYREKTLFCIGLIADQSPVREELDYWTPFLNQDTPVFLGAEKMARKTRSAVVFFAMQKIKRGHYEITIEEICDDPMQTKPFEITEKHVRILEHLIRQKPEHWVWSHRRWKFNKEDTMRKKKSADKNKPNLS